MAIKNMYMTPLNYTNFSGVKRTTKLHFHLTPREFVDWMLENREQADKLMGDFMKVRGDIIEGEGETPSEFNSEDIRIMLRMVKVLAELSYGIPSDDGEVFDKSGLQRFVYSASYDAFRLFLFENPRELEQFFTNILNAEVVEEFGKRMADVVLDESEEPAAIQPKAPVSPRDMSMEELQAAMAEKLSAQKS